MAGLVGGVALTRARRYLGSAWLWGGVGFSLLIFLPNLVWQAQHNFIHLQFLSAIHARDIAIGRTQSFLFEQIYVAANPVTIPLWVAGLYFYFFAPAGRPFRLLGWMAVIPFALLLVAQDVAITPARSTRRCWRAGWCMGNIGCGRCRLGERGGCGRPPGGR